MRVTGILSRSGACSDHAYRSSRLSVPPLRARYTKVSMGRPSCCDSIRATSSNFSSSKARLARDSSAVGHSTCVQYLRTRLEPQLATSRTIEHLSKGSKSTPNFVEHVQNISHTVAECREVHVERFHRQLAPRMRRDQRIPCEPTRWSAMQVLPDMAGID